MIPSVPATTELGGLGTILSIWAHPDDEAYLAAGTMAISADAGQHVACVTATFGEDGETADPDRWPRERLAEIRRDEMARSLDILGVTDHRWLGLADGTLGAVDRADGVDHVADAIQRVQPDTVLTFGPDGMTGHPDHRTISDWTLDAFRATAAPDSRLLAATKTAAWGNEFPVINAEVFPDGPPSTPVDRLALTVTLDGEMLDRKIRALEAQSSQTTGIIAAMGPARYRQWVQREYWVQIAGRRP